LGDEGVSEDEVANARDYLVGIMPLQMQTAEQLAAALANLLVFDLPVDYFLHYRDRIAAVSVDDVTHAARAHVRPAQLAIVVIGDAAAIRSGLEALGRGPLRDA